jgi:hypothetical protein
LTSSRFVARECLLLSPRSGDKAVVCSNQRLEVKSLHHSASCRTFSHLLNVHQIYLAIR